MMMMRMMIDAQLLSHESFEWIHTSDTLHFSQHFFSHFLPIHCLIIGFDEIFFFVPFLDLSTDQDVTMSMSMFMFMFSSSSTWRIFWWFSDFFLNFFIFFSIYQSKRFFHQRIYNETMKKFFNNNNNNKTSKSNELFDQNKKKMCSMFFLSMTDTRENSLFSVLYVV